LAICRNSLRDHTRWFNGLDRLVEVSWTCETTTVSRSHLRSLGLLRQILLLLPMPVCFGLWCTSPRECSLGALTLLMVLVLTLFQFLCTDRINMTFVRALLFVINPLLSVLLSADQLVPLRSGSHSHRMLPSAGSVCPFPRPALVYCVMLKVAFPGHLCLLAARLTLSWTVDATRVFNAWPTPGTNQLTSLHDSVLFSVVTPIARVCHYGPDLASWSVGPESCFVLAAASPFPTVVDSAVVLLRFVSSLSWVP
jgi:hypothetical protein